MNEELYMRFSLLLGSSMLVPTVVFFSHSISQRNMAFWRVAAIGFLCLFANAILSAMSDFVPKIAGTLIPNLLVGVGYFLGTKSIRLIKDIQAYPSVDYAVLAIYSTACIANYFMINTYESRVLIVSTGIISFSILILILALRKDGRKNLLGDGLIAIFAFINTIISLLRASATLLDDNSTWLRLELIDPVFFVWSITAVVAFATGHFINGNACIAAETQKHFEHVSELAEHLQAAIEDQQNLQKLLLHELKRPMNAISAATQAALQTDDPSNRINELRRLRRLIDSANSYIEGIGEYEELSSLLTTPNIETLTLDSIASDLRSKWGLSVELDPALAARNCRGDPLLIDIALGNLVENAHKFGGESADCRVRITANDSHAFFDVIDGGPGIAEAYWDKVWGKFYKISDTPSSSVRGCGLGLHMVKQIAELHGGHAQVLSRQPSTIRFTLPLYT